MSTAWFLEPTTGDLVPPAGQSTNMSSAEFNRQQWPACPNCERMLVVQAIDASSVAVLDEIFPGPHPLLGRLRHRRGAGQMTSTTMLRFHFDAGPGRGDGSMIERC